MEVEVAIGSGDGGVSNENSRPKKSPLKRKKANSFTWDKILSTSGVKAAPVSCFQHVPFSNVWNEYAIGGIRVEVESDGGATTATEGPAPETDEVIQAKAWWVATILQFAGYKTKIRYVGFDENSEHDKWLNFCLDLYAISFSTRNRKKLLPPPGLPEPPPKDWRKYLLDRIVGAKTLIINHKETFRRSLKSNVIIGSFYEVLDKKSIRRMRLAKVTKVVGGRVQLTYWDSLLKTGGSSEDFWCHERSTKMCPIGWCKTVGHQIAAPYDYDPLELEEKEIGDFLGAASWFKTKIGVGMRLEAVDPLNLGQICAARIVKVLRFDYFMVKIDSYVTKHKRGSDEDQFCFHITSPLIFPCGFCNTHGIKLEPPVDSEHIGTFDWKSYFEKTGAIPLEFRQEPRRSHGFEPLMKLEAVDVITPSIIAVATVARVVEGILLIHFDGWGTEYDQWTDASSLDLFPVGWCEATGYPLEAPKLLKSPKKIQKTIL